MSIQNYPNLRKKKAIPAGNSSKIAVDYTLSLNKFLWAARPGSILQAPVFPVNPRKSLQAIHDKQIPTKVRKGDHFTETPFYNSLPEYRAQSDDTNQQDILVPPVCYH